MRSSSKGSQSQGKKSRRLVKNKVMIGDARLNMGVKLENRDMVPRATRTTASSDNYLASQVPDKFRKLGRTDGTNFNREIGAKKPRAAQVYGSRKKALKASYRIDKMTRERIPGSEYKEKKKQAPAKKQTGGLTRKSSAKPGTAANPIMGSAGRRSNRARGSFI